MEQNEGTTDRWIRLMVGLASIYLGFAYNTWWFLLALIGIFTAADGFCLLYKPLGISTLKGKADKFEEGELNPAALAAGFGLFAAIDMVTFGIMGMYGMFRPAVSIVQSFFLDFGLSLEGIALGAIQSALYAYIAGYVIAWVYNRLR